MKDRAELYPLCCFFLIAISLIMPAYANVISFKTDKTFFVKGDKITFSGTVEDHDVGELVTIVIEDPAGNFVKLTQAYPDADNKFQATVDTTSKFSSHGTYNATAFITNKTNGIVIKFDLSLDGTPIIHPPPEIESQPNPTPQPVPQTNENEESSTESSTKPSITEVAEDEKTIQEKIKERIEAAKKQREAQVNQQNQTKSNEAKIEQTDSNIPTGVTDDTTVIENKPPTTGISTPIDLESNLLYIVIGLGGAGAVGGVVYGIKTKNKRKPGDKPIVKIREVEKASAPTEDDYALMILKNRLAKGEITIEEYNALKEALREP